MLQLSQKRLIVLAFSLFSCLGCSQSPFVLYTQSPQRLQQQNLSAPLSAKRWLKRAQAEAQKWDTQAEITGIYALQLAGEAFLSYEFQARQNQQENLFVKILADGTLTSRLSPLKQIGPALPLPEWQVTAQEALELARQHGFAAQDDFGVGLNYWQGMGIPVASLKWSVLSFGDASAQDYFVIDASSRHVWRCQPTTNPVEGCASVDLSSHFSELF